MIGVIVNTLAVLLGGSLGLLLRRAIPEKITKAVMTGIALCTLYLGFSGSLVGKNPLITIASISLGAVLGTLLQIDRAITKLGEYAQKRSGGRFGPVGEAFVTSSLLFCVGSMTIVGSLNAGIQNDQQMLFAKSFLDLISSVMLAASLGAGVLLSSAVILLFQGGIVLSARFIAPLLSAGAIAEMSCAGSILIIALGLNLLGLSKIKTADYLPAILIAPLIYSLSSLF